MSKIERLEDLYAYMEKVQYFTNGDLENLRNQIVHVRDVRSKEKDKNEATKAQWEVDFFLFTIQEGILKGFMSGIDKEDKFYEEPSVNNFTEEQYEYLIQRQKSVNNPLVKTRYSHILWLSKQKKYDFVKDAIDGYLILLKQFEEKSKETLKVIRLIDVIKNVIALAVPVKYRVDEIKVEIIRLINTYETELNPTFILKQRLLYIMLDYKNVFGKADFVGMENICEALANKLTNQDKIGLLELGEKIEIKQGKKDSKWQLGIATTYEQMMQERQDDTNIIPIEYCQRAIIIYKSLKMDDKVESLTKTLTTLKADMKLGLISHEFDLTDMVKGIREVADSFTEQSSDIIIEGLMSGQDIIPEQDKLDLQDGENRFLSFASITLYDGKRNTAEHVQTEEEHEHHNLIFKYNMSIKLGSNHIIREIIFAAIRKEKLSAEILIDYFQRNSWFGKDLPDNKSSYNWTLFIAPSLIEYFRQMEFSFIHPKYYPNFVLVMDSMVLKIEGLLRDLCKFKGGDTFYMKTDDNKRPISREKDITNLLYDDVVVNFLDKDDLLFFRYTFIEQWGLNLRHKISHCLMKKEDYSLENMNLVLVALLRLGKYDFKE